jgi:hypothetical protein
MNKKHGQEHGVTRTGTEKHGVEVGELVPSRACAPAREGGEIANWDSAIVVTAYRDAVGGVFAVIRFGAMMAELDASLTRETTVNASGQITGREPGLKGWLAANCPEVAYKTAMRMKGTAEAVCAAFGCAPGALLRAMNPDPKALPDEEDCEAMIALREMVTEVVTGKSERSLVLWLKGGVPAIAAGEDAQDEGTGKTAEIALDSSRRFARAIADALKCLDSRQCNIVGQDVAKSLRDALGLKGLAWLAHVLQQAEG